MKKLILLFLTLCFTLTACNDDDVQIADITFPNGGKLRVVAKPKKDGQPQQYEFETEGLSRSGLREEPVSDADFLSTLETLSLGNSELGFGRILSKDIEKAKKDFKDSGQATPVASDLNNVDVLRRLKERTQEKYNELRKLREEAARAEDISRVNALDMESSEYLNDLKILRALLHLKGTGEEGTWNNPESEDGRTLNRVRQAIQRR